MSLGRTCYNQMEARLKNSKEQVVQLLTHLVDMKMILQSKLLLHAPYKIYTLLINHSMYDLALSLVEIKSFLWKNLQTNIYVGSLEGA